MSVIVTRPRRGRAAKIAIVMTYPYESEKGGEQIYVSRLRDFLVSQGILVDTFITDAVRGRSSPLVRLQTYGGGGRTAVRRALALGRDFFLVFDPGLLSHLVRRALTGKGLMAEGERIGESGWVEAELERGDYDGTILMWSAHRLLTPRRVQRPVVIPGFFSASTFALGDPPQIVASQADLEALRRWPVVGFNNQWEASAMRAHLSDSRVIHVSIGFAGKSQLAAFASQTVLFVGARTGANSMSADWLLSRVWPRVIEAVPDATLVIVGAICEEIISQPGVILRGSVADLEAEYLKAGVVVAPLVIGSLGVKTKVAEAVAHGRPLVTTSLGVDPADVDQLTGAAILADNPEDFATAVINVLSDRELREAMAAKTRLVFARCFSEDAAYGELADILSDLGAVDFSGRVRGGKHQ